jgi:hypothetical protein
MKGFEVEKKKKEQEIKKIQKDLKWKRKGKEKGIKIKQKDLKQKRKGKGNKDKKWGRVGRGRFLHAGIETTTVNEPNGTLKVEL